MPHLPQTLIPQIPNMHTIQRYHIYLLSLSLYNTDVTGCTTASSLSKLLFCLHRAFMGFVWF
jgi:hypothetical protein